MKWEPVENAENKLSRRDTVICWIIVYDSFTKQEDKFDVCIYNGKHLRSVNNSKYYRYEITHFMVVEEPGNENTKPS